MINGNLNDFLVSGWFSEATLYLNGYTYWCEGGYNDYNDDEHRFHFWVYRYRSTLHKINDDIYTTRMIVNNDVADYSVAFEAYGKSLDEIKPKFLSAKIFDGKTFWEVEKEIAWYDED